MQSLTENLELLKNKALECELIAQLATDRIARAANLKRAALYLELIREAEAALRISAHSPRNNEEPRIRT
jgi:hypothetical protein